MTLSLRLACLAALLAACGGTDPGDDPVVASVDLAPDAPSLETGATLQLTATLRTSGGTVVSGRPITWTSSEEDVATVDESGLVTGVGPGSSEVAATADGVSGAVTVSVTSAAVASVTVTTGGAQPVPGQQLQLTATARDAAGNALEGKAFTWTSDDPARATVSATGLVQALAAGTVTISATTEGRIGVGILTVREGGLVGSAGGTVSAFGGAFTLSVPAGALGGDVALAVSRPAARPLDATATDAVYALEPAATTFAVPATLALAYDPGSAPRGVPESALGLRRLNGGAWQPLADGTVDEGADVATTGIEAAGTFGVGRLPASTACTSAESRQFDFWLGSWDVTPTGSPPGTRAARSEIAGEAGGCAIFEDFTDLSYHGVSINVFDPATAKWYQTYVDTDGARLLLVGTFSSEGMRLVNEQSSQRITWTELSGSRVRQLGENSNNGGQTWTTGFDLEYQPR
jgi:hypothetical protein